MRPLLFPRIIAAFATRNESLHYRIAKVFRGRIIGSVSDEATVKFANDAFYAAFASRDLAAMDGLWAKRARCSCIHPGWQAVHGRAAVMQTWTAILGNPNTPHITCAQPRAYPLGDIAYVICYETVENSVLVATNVFVREDGTWRLIHHQAGQSTLPAPADSDDPAPTLQ